MRKLAACMVLALVVPVVLAGCGPGPDATPTPTPSGTGPFFETEVSFQSEDSDLTGTIAVPDGVGPFPAVIVLAGSGPFDRNGDVDPRVVEASQQAGQPVMALSSTYRDIAQALSTAGMVTLRYDKREVGNSTGEQGDFPEPSVRDLRAAVAFLREHPSVDAQRIGLVGHSLGGLWALMMAAEDPDIAAVCTLAAPARPYGEVIVEQIEGLLPLQGASESDIAATVDQQRAVYAQLRSGELDPEAFPEPTRSELEFVKAIMDIAGGTYAKEIESPALIVQGGKDLFTVVPSEAEALRDAYIEGGNEQVELVVFPDLDHVFRPTPGEPSLDLYYEDRGPISGDAVETIVEWMTGNLL